MKIKIHNKFAKAVALSIAMLAFLSACGSNTAESEVPISENSESVAVYSEMESVSSIPDSEEALSEVTESVEEVKEPLRDHVEGLASFSIIEGRTPDLSAGIHYDETIASVAADDSACDYLTPGTYPISYTIYGSDGRSEVVNVEVTVTMDLEQYLYGMEGYAIVTLGGSFDPMENVETDPEIVSIVPDATELNTQKEGDYLISYELTGTNGQTQTAIRQVSVMTEAEKAAFDAGVALSEIYSSGNVSSVTHLGLWRLTAYMDTPEDQGKYVGQTASGAPLVAGRTVAVSQATCARLGLKFGDQLMIDGHIYVLEDYGGSAMNDQLWADIFVDNVADEYSEKYNHYTNVYLVQN